MGFFRNLWDETLAGPAKDSGVGKFRRYNSLLSRSNISASTGENADDNTPVSRSITILRTNSLTGSSSGSTPSSPTGSSAAGSPFSGSSPGGDSKKLTRRKSSADAATRREPKSPTGYDWYYSSCEQRIVLTSLDR